MADFVESIRNGWLDDFTSTTKYLALFDGDPQGAGTEISGGSYARVEITASDWAAASGGTLSNTAEKSFPQASADWNSGSAISHFAICTAGTADVSDVEASDALTTSKTVTSGDTASFAVGELDLTIT
jgi:hypothetical protein